MYRGLLLLFLTATAHATLSQPDADLTLQVRLQNHLTSYGSRAGTPFRCVVVAPFEVQGQILIPAGSIVYGEVKRAVSVRLGLVHERAVMELRFLEYQLPDGQRLPLFAKLTAIDNAREQVTRNGEIKGILAAQKPDEVVNGVWTRPALNMFYRPIEGLTGMGQELLERFPMGPAAPALILGLRCLVLPFAEPEIHLIPGTDLQLRVDQVRSQFIRKAAPEVLHAPPDLSNWIATKPLSVEKTNGQPAADLINVAFIGSRQELLDAFSAAGWFRAEPSGFRAFRRVYEAFDEKKGYERAPVSRLLYQGRDPELVFEKSFDTISKRHHIRIWSAGAFEDEQVWVGAATHDIGIGFDGKSLRFIHAIDTKLDWERSKVITDLTFAGCAATPVYSDPRPGADDQKAVSIVTDGRIAILSLRACLPSQDTAEESPAAPGNKATRFARRVILESRDYLFRENAYFFAYEFVRRVTHKIASE